MTPPSVEIGCLSVEFYAETLPSQIIRYLEVPKICINPQLDPPKDQDKANYAALLRQCKNSRALSVVHADMVRDGRDRGTFLGNILVQMYGKCKEMEHARAVFDKITFKNVFSWTMVIAAYAQNGDCREAIQLYREMNQKGVRPDKVSYLSILGACTQLGDLAQGKAIHARIASTGFDLDVVVGNAIIDMYGKCGSVEWARKVFDSMPWKDVISWNSMLAVYVQLGHPHEVLQLYRHMDVKPDDATFVNALGACTMLEALQEGIAIHEQAVNCGYESQLVLGTALVNMYGRCGCFSEARAVFEKIPNKDVICWTNMISAYAQYGHPRDALGCLRQMDWEGFKPNFTTFVAVVEACTHLGDLAEGRLVHARIVANNLDSDIVLGTGILHMYAKFGNLTEARKVFNKLHHSSPDVITWNCMLTAYAQSGHGREVLKFHQMMNVEGVKPTDITFVAILCACSYLGLLDKSYEHFSSMVQDYGILPTAEHYGCLVDLLARSGRLLDAESLIESMPVHPGAIVWKVLLSACKLHGDMERGARAAANASELEPQDDSTYVLLSNIFSTRIQA